MLPRQRGVYSEILVTQDNEQLKGTSTVGPNKDTLIKANAVQKVPRASGKILYILNYDPLDSK